MSDISDVKRLTPEMRRAQTRTYLLDAAAAVFTARGFHNATLDEIAEAAGFTKGAIYSNFGSKEDLFLALVQQRQDAMVEQFFAAAAPGSGDRAPTITDVYRRLAPTPSEWVLWEEFVLYTLRNPELREHVEAVNTGGFDLLVGMVENHCRELGVQPPMPPAVLTRLYLAVFDGLARQRAVETAGIPDDLFTTIVTFIDDAVRQLGEPLHTPAEDETAP